MCMFQLYMFHDFKMIFLISLGRDDKRYIIPTSCARSQIVRLGFFILFFVLSGCSLWPQYEVPGANIPTDWTEQGTNTRLANNDRWWRNFHDPFLNELIEQQSVHNLNLKMAEARVVLARSEFAMATAQYFPTASIYTLPPNGTGITITQVVALTTALEIDLFGRIRHTRERAKANVEAEQATRNFALLNLYAEIATSYLEFREAQARDKILHHNLSDNQQVLAFLKSRYHAGLSNYLNIAQQNAFVETQWAELEQNKAVITALLHKIELLTGNNPGSLSRKLLKSKPVPEITNKINLNVPSALLRRRPDIIAAERRVAAAHANINVATSDLFPKLTLGWLLGWQTQTLHSALYSLKNPDSTMWGILNIPILNVSLYRNIDIQKQIKVLAILQYQVTIMVALHEVENQYSYCQHAEQSAAHFKRAVNEKRLVLRLSRDAYEKGVSDFNIVLRSEEDLNRLESAYLHNVVIHQIARVNLYKALGGGMNTTKEGK